MTRVYVNVIGCDVAGFYRLHHSTTIWATFHSVKPSVYLNVCQQSLPTSSQFCLAESVGQTVTMTIFHT